MKNIIAKLFNIQDLLIDRISSKGREYFIHARSSRTVSKCPLCKASTKKIHQKHLRKIKHGWYQGKIIYILLKKKRFYCKECQKPFTEKIKGLDSYSRSSNKAKEQIILELPKQSFQSTAKKFNLSTSTIIRYLNVFSKTDILWPKRGSIKLGVDAHSFRGKDMVFTISEIKRGRLLTILKDDQKQTLLNFLAQIPENIKERIEEVCIDMDQGTKAALEKIFRRDARITVDKFHLIKEANYVIDDFRRILQYQKDRIPRMIWLTGEEKLSPDDLERISDYQERYPELFKCWSLKERLREFYMISNKRIASFKLSKIIKEYESMENTYAKSFSRTLERWRNEILNYFDHNTTNAVTEGIHTKIKMVKRVSFGFRNINNYIAKVSLAFFPLMLLLNNYHTN